MAGAVAVGAVAGVMLASSAWFSSSAFARADDVVPFRTIATKADTRKAAPRKRSVAQSRQGSDGATGDKTAKTARPVSYAALFQQFQIDARSVGYIAIDAATGRVLAARQPDGGFIPASSIKAPTAIMALNVLGANHRFSTRLYMTGSVRGGVLDGDVILVGGGDPELFTDDFSSLVAALKARGISRVAGRFIYDNSLFPDSSAVSAAHDDVTYNAGVGALSLNFNRLRLRWARTAKGTAIQIFAKTDRSAVPVSIVNGAVAPPGTRTKYGVAWDDSGVTPRWLLSSRIRRRRGEMWVPVKRVGLHAAHVFQQYARAAGVILPKPRPGRRPDGASVVANHPSDPLLHIARRFLKYSNNVATEIIGQVTTRRLTGKPLTIERSGAVMAAWFKQKLPDVNWAGLRIANHSGLSRDTSISPRQMAAILQWARTQNYAGYALKDILRPYWVGTGTAFTQKRFQRRRPARGNVRFRKRVKRRAASRRVKVPWGVAAPDFAAWMKIRGKTGTINHARSLAGYLVTKSKREVVFAVFIDDDRAQLAAARAGQRYKRMSQGRWSWRSRAVLRGILRKWMLEF